MANLVNDIDQIHHTFADYPLQNGPFEHIEKHVSHHINMAIGLSLDNVHAESNLCRSLIEKGRTIFTILLDASSKVHTVVQVECGDLQTQYRENEVNNAGPPLPRDVELNAFDRIQLLYTESVARRTTVGDINEAAAAKSGEITQRRLNHEQQNGLPQIHEPMTVAMAQDVEAQSIAMLRNQRAARRLLCEMRGLHAQMEGILQQVKAAYNEAVDICLNELHLVNVPPAIP